MNAVVVYESYWGNTASIASAIAEGLGGGAQAITTDLASDQVLALAQLIVVGAPLLGFTLPTDTMRKTLPGKMDAPSRADVDHPSMRAWLAAMPAGSGRFASFETRLKRSPGAATKRIEKGLEAAGRTRLLERERFLVGGTYGPLLDGELERARQWGAALAEAMGRTH
ncbi:MAG: flavodoxin-like domain-containing protein [Actinobacteria bacterium]|nr:flavodoxin-like domain-containing protein [Actinomycetota bacterium]